MTDETTGTVETMAETLPPPTIDLLTPVQQKQLTGYVNQVVKKQPKLYESSDMSCFTLSWAGLTTEEGVQEVQVYRVGDVIELKANGYYDTWAEKLVDEADMECYYRISKYCVAVTGCKYSLPETIEGDHGPMPGTFMTLKAIEPGWTVVTYIIRDHVNKAEKILYYPIVIVE